jgi:hypothetical protein
MKRKKSHCTSVGAVFAEVETHAPMHVCVLEEGRQRLAAMGCRGAQLNQLLQDLLTLCVRIHIEERKKNERS